MSIFFPSSEAGVVWSEVLCRRVKPLVHGQRGVCGACLHRVDANYKIEGSVRDQKCLVFFPSNVSRFILYIALYSLEIQRWRSESNLKWESAFQIW